MQQHALKAVDLSTETQATRDICSADSMCWNFGKRCLLARRLVEQEFGSFSFTQVAITTVPTGTTATWKKS
ncbi:MAG: DUF1501 domain-containing protein [Pirellulales bacterium]